jgi:hypothetical protein
MDRYSLTHRECHRDWSREATILVGLAESPILNLKLTNVRLAGKKGVIVKYAQATSTNFTGVRRTG